MNYNNPYLSNPYGGVAVKTPQQMQDEYNNLMATYSNMYNSSPQNNQANNFKQQNQNPAVTDKGQYIKVTSFEEVQNYPTSLDGTASLFFDFTNKVFWSKKFINGSHAVQAFKFEPINNAEQKLSTDIDVDYTKDLDNIVDPIDERFNKIEKMLENLLTKKSSTPRQPKEKKEVIENEI